MGNAWIIGGARTARGRGKLGKGALSGVHPQELLAQTLNEVIARRKIDAREVDDVVAGCVSQAEERGACIARNAVLAAGLPDETTGVTVNRFCGSGLQAINFGAMGVASGHQGFVLAGGVAPMSLVPMGSDEAGIDGNNLELRKKNFLVPRARLRARAEECRHEGERHPGRERGSRRPRGVRRRDASTRPRTPPPDCASGCRHAAAFFRTARTRPARGSLRRAAQSYRDRSRRAPRGAACRSSAFARPADPCPRSSAACRAPRPRARPPPESAPGAGPASRGAPTSRAAST